MSDLFVSNRQRLAAELKGGIVVLSAYTQMQRSNDTAFTFEQEANFWWLTGIEAADWWLIFDGTRDKSWLVAPKLSEVQEIFDGSLSPEAAKKISGIETVVSHDEGMKLLRDLAKKHSMAYTLGEQPHAQYLDFTLNPAPRKMYELLDRTFNSVHDCRKELSRLRAIKQPEEIVRMKKAINLTIDAFEYVKAMLPLAKYEYEVEAEFTYYFRRHGAEGHAYDPIVASGKNACTLHYVDNNAKLKKRELLLMDIGARHCGYTADLTRTYALGEPTKRQQTVHDLVQSAHQEIIKLVKPGVSVEQYLRESDRIMGEALVQLGLISDAKNRDMIRKYFPHSISHGLGIDVHDSLGGARVLQPGMALMVEPGIYIPEEGIGMRLEDCILLTQSGHTNLSARLSTDL
jgi:Xaa-Pro aminopeptidase